MSEPIAISARGLSKRFRLQRERRLSFKERVVRGRAARGRDFWALRDVDFDIPRGSFFGIIGHNGSGKSTALKVLAGIYRPTSGTVAVNGRVSALLELGAGFHPELTGRENIQLNGAILGMTPREIRRSMDDIIEFAGLADFIDSPVKVYSSGMSVRLGFAVAVKMDPEILVVDEVIAVGDEQFQRRCFDHLFDLRQRGTTIVLVTHSMAAVEGMCDEAIWLDHGRARSRGTARDVVREYLRQVNADEAAATGVTPETSDGFTRVGSGEVRVTDVEYLGQDERPLDIVTTGSPCRYRIWYEAEQTIDACDLGVAFHHESGVYVAGPLSRATGPFRIQAGTGYVDFVVAEVLLQPGIYTISTAIVTDGHFFDYVDRAFRLTVRGAGGNEPGLVRMPGTWLHPRAVSSARVPALPQGAAGEPVTDASLRGERVEETLP